MSRATAPRKDRNEPLVEPGILPGFTAGQVLEMKRHDEHRAIEINVGPVEVSGGKDAHAR